MCDRKNNLVYLAKWREMKASERIAVRAFSLMAVCLSGWMRAKWNICRCLKYPSLKVKSCLLLSAEERQYDETHLLVLRCVLVRARRAAKRRARARPTSESGR